MMNRADTEEDEQRTKIFHIEGSQRSVISIHPRRKWMHSYEYECSFELGGGVGFKGEKWTLMSTADNVWIPRTELNATHTKLVAEMDRQESMNGQFRLLVRLEIEQHPKNFGLLPTAAAVLLDVGRSGLMPCGPGCQGGETPEGEKEKGPGKGGSGTEEDGRAGE